MLDNTLSFIPFAYNKQINKMFDMPTDPTFEQPQAYEANPGFLEQSISS